MLDNATPYEQKIEITEKAVQTCKRKLNPLLPCLPSLCL